MKMIKVIMMFVCLFLVTSITLYAGQDCLGNFTNSLTQINSPALALNSPNAFVANDTCWEYGMVTSASGNVVLGIAWNLDRRILSWGMVTTPITSHQSLGSRMLFWKGFYYIGDDYGTVYRTIDPTSNSWTKYNTGLNSPISAMIVDDSKMYLFSLDTGVAISNNGTTYQMLNDTPLIGIAGGETYGNSVVKEFDKILYANQTNYLSVMDTSGNITKVSSPYAITDVIADPRGVYVTGYVSISPEIGWLGFYNGTNIISLATTTTEFLVNMQRGEDGKIYAVSDNCSVSTSAIIYEWDGKTLNQEYTLSLPKYSSGIYKMVNYHNNLLAFCGTSTLSQQTGQVFIKNYDMEFIVTNGEQRNLNNETALNTMPHGTAWGDLYATDKTQIPLYVNAFPWGDDTRYGQKTFFEYP
jgi:hypothetical protein